MDGCGNQSERNAGLVVGACIVVGLVVILLEVLR